MIKSTIREGYTAPFPEHTGERVHMVPFKDVLPDNLSRWQRTVDVMLRGIEIPNKAYLMIDQQELKYGQYHRRPGVHVDGNWVGAGFDHDPPNDGYKHPPTKPTKPKLHLGRHSHDHYIYKPELVILASNVSACEAYVGEFDGTPDSQGSCDHFDLSKAERVFMHKFKVYTGTATTLHRTLPVLTDCKRTVVRINVPGLTV